MKSYACVLLAVGAFSLPLTGCLSGSDRFYRLQPDSAAAGARQQFSAEVSIRITIPSLVDRNQLVLDQGAGVQILEHDRWAAPLVDQLRTVLGQDLEQRRPDILVTDRPLSQAAGSVRYIVQVDIVAVTLRRGSLAQVETRWRVERDGSGSSRAGRDILAAKPGDATAAGLAIALSQCISGLAERLAQQIEPVASQS